MKLTQNQFFGEDNTKPISFTPGAIFIAVDTYRIYIYNKFKKPIDVTGDFETTGITPSQSSSILNNTDKIYSCQVGHKRKQTCRSSNIHCCWSFSLFCCVQLLHTPDKDR